MYLLAQHYEDEDIRDNIIITLDEIIDVSREEPIFICIGSDRHLLDCFGPLVGTMIKEKTSELSVYGTLENPLNSQNLSEHLQKIRNTHYSEYIEIAVDASLGSREDLGIIKIRKGPILPGKALDKKLPPVGQIAITGIVGERLTYKNIAGLKTGSIKPVYFMAKVLSEAIVDWYFSHI
ncbi:spore protease YyaC [Thermosyntropha sp.]|uniref:spore protease YyaC n=1 Tax=Thermosyntropha sp. TaxID=2740820 RepID=UPI0025FC4286|nr:spore protease YyaC [Thermosyntropha sp.]MBO8158467.1 spore protease YyaC [Thermosyntropha sp.]